MITSQVSSTARETSSLGCAHPTVLRDVEDHAVGIPVLALEMEGLPLNWQVHEEGAAAGLDGLGLAVQVVAPEADVMDAYIVLAAFLASGSVGLVLEKGKADR